MKSKATFVWFVFAVALAAGIWLCQKFLPAGPPAIAPLLPGLRAAALTAVQISPAGAREITAVRTNGAWQLVKPLAYPAQTAAIEALAGALEKLAPATRLTAADLRGHENADADFGFENPQFAIDLAAGGQTWHLLVGKKTAPGDQVFIRVVGLDGAFVTDAGWLQRLPHSADEWRDTALVAAGPVDWLVITNGTKAMEFRRDPTNQLWRMIRPLAARADGARLAAALEQLLAGHVVQFVTDDRRTDLSGYGLQPADLDVWLGRGNNFTAAIHVGMSPPDNPALVYAQREGWNAVVTAGKDTFLAWRGSVNDFRDPHLLTPTAPVAEIEVRGAMGNFTLQQRGPGRWAVAGEKFPADLETVQAYLKLLASLRVSEFVKDVVTATDLQGFGFTPPARQIILRGAAGDTNSVLVQLLFGNTETNRVLVKRGDEDFIYALKPADVAQLPEHGWEFRDRCVWSFSETNVARVTLRQNGQTRELVRTGNNKWSFGPTSQGIINPPALEETVHRLGELIAAGWVARHVTEPEKYGLKPDNLSLTIELKSGEKLGLDFGAELAQGRTALAAVTLDGERWAFVFPPALYQFVAAYLTLPPT